MKPRERALYSAIVDRPPLALPQGLRLILWPVVNLEVWEIERPMARQVLPAPTGVSVVPDLPNWAWHEYGMRVGVWRFFEAFDQRQIRPTLALNADVYVKAGEYTLEKLDPGERQALAEVKARIEFLPFLPGYSTTELIKKISAAAKAGAM